VAQPSRVWRRAKTACAFRPSSNLLWKTDVPKGLSSPITWKDSIFATGADSNRLVTLCLDRQGGKRLWEQAIIVENSVHGANRSPPTPVTDGRAVYAYFGSFGMVASDLRGRNSGANRCPYLKPS
jgi:hypothetical protein